MKVLTPGHKYELDKLEAKLAKITAELEMWRDGNIVREED